MELVTAIISAIIIMFAWIEYMSKLNIQHTNEKRVAFKRALKFTAVSSAVPSLLIAIAYMQSTVTTTKLTGVDSFHVGYKYNMNFVEPVDLIKTETIFPYWSFMKNDVTVVQVQSVEK